MAREGVRPPRRAAAPRGAARRRFGGPGRRVARVDVRGGPGARGRPCRRHRLLRERRGRLPGGLVPAVPEPHIRTNAFMIERSLLFGLDIEELTDTVQCLRVESGAAGLTAQVLARGLRPVVVDRDGVAHDMAAWPGSATFRSGGQAGLLVADNRTRDWEAGGRGVPGLALGPLVGRGGR